MSICASQSGVYIDEGIDVDALELMSGVRSSHTMSMEYEPSLNGPTLSKCPFPVSVSGTTGGGTNAV